MRACGLYALSHVVVSLSVDTGDIHGGNVVRDYNDKDGQPVEQRGVCVPVLVSGWYFVNGVGGNHACVV